MHKLPVLPMAYYTFWRLDFSATPKGLSPGSWGRMVHDNLFLENRPETHADLHHSPGYYSLFDVKHIQSALDNYAREHHWSPEEQEHAWHRMLSLSFERLVKNEQYLHYKEDKLKFKSPAVLKEYFGYIDKVLTTEYPKKEQKNSWTPAKEELGNYTHLMYMLGQEMYKSRWLLNELNPWWKSTVEFVRNIQQMDDFNFREILGKSGHDTPFERSKKVRHLNKPSSVKSLASKYKFQRGDHSLRHFALGYASRLPDHGMTWRRLTMLFPNPYLEKTAYLRYYSDVYNQAEAFDSLANGRHALLLNSLKNAYTSGDTEFNFFINTLIDHCPPEQHANLLATFWKELLNEQNYSHFQGEVKSFVASPLLEKVNMDVRRQVFQEALMAHLTKEPSYISKWRDEKPKNLFLIMDDLYHAFALRYHEEDQPDVMDSLKFVEHMIRLYSPEVTNKLSSLLALAGDAGDLARLWEQELLVPEFPIIDLNTSMDFT